jgi:hypothetical protein
MRTYFGKIITLANFSLNSLSTTVSLIVGNLFLFSPSTLVVKKDSNPRLSLLFNNIDKTACITPVKNLLHFFILQKRSWHKLEIQ